jgi:hypothetical protein
MLVFNLTGYSQETTSLVKKQTPISVGLNIGTQSFPGLDFTLSPYKNLNLRIAYGFINYKIRDAESDFGRLPDDLKLDGDVQMSNFSIVLERTIWKEWIRIAAGFGLFQQNRLAVKVQLSNSQTINDLELSPEEIGYGYGEVEWKNRLNPYLGLGIGRAIPKNKWNFSCDLGFFYKGAPRFDMQATNLLRTNERNEDLIEEKLQFIKWIPNINIRISRRIL